MPRKSQKLIGIKISQKTVIFYHFFSYNNRTRSKMKILACSFTRGCFWHSKTVFVFVVAQKLSEEIELEEVKMQLFRRVNKWNLFVNIYYKTNILNFNLEGFYRPQDFNNLGHCLVHPRDWIRVKKINCQIWPILAVVSPLQVCDRADFLLTLFYH